VTINPRIEIAGPNSRHLEAAARLHCASLTETLTSTRGEQVLRFSYRHLARSGHPIYVVIEDDRVIGGLVVLSSSHHHSSPAVLLYQPTSWFRALRELGMTDFVGKFLDLLQVRRRARLLNNHDYIIAIYIDEGQRRRGLAGQLLERATGDSSARGVGLAVDTDSSNFAAHALYASFGFVELARTSRSVIYSKDLG